MGILATPFAGNVPDIDLLAHANQRSAPVQVKAINTTNSASWQFDIRRFLNVEVINGKQKVFGINEDLDRSLICVFVRLGEDEADDEFYIFRQGFLQDHFARIYKGRNPPKNVNSIHCAIWTKDISRSLSD